MSGTYTSDEKVEYALKTALFRTMQSKDQPSSLEKSAPPRIFPKNIMKVNLIEKGEGDIDEDGYYVGRATASSAYNGSNDLVNLEEPELTISNYRIIDPSSNKITDKRVSDLTTVTISETNHSSIDALPTTGTTYPLKNWFFRGHYGSHTGTTAFNAASSSYDGLQLAWDKSTVGNTATEEDIVPHLKFYLQVQTNFTNVAHGDNITYGHDLMKGLVGLDQNFSTTIQVVQGEGGGCATLGTTGASTGDFWFTQATSGTLSFYGVTDKVNASASLSNLATTKFPMISFIRYTGETGFGAGSGGGGSTSLASNDSNVSNMIAGTAQTMTTTTYNFNGNVGIGTTNPLCASHIERPLPMSSYPMAIPSANSTSFGIGVHQFLSSRYTDGNLNQYGLVMGSDGSSYYLQHMSTNHNYYYNLSLNPKGGKVGIGTNSPDAQLDLWGPTNNPTTATMSTSASQAVLRISGAQGQCVEIGGMDSTNLYGIWMQTHNQSSTSNTQYSRNLCLQPLEGNVGIGTTNPHSKLNVFHNGTHSSSTYKMKRFSVNDSTHYNLVWQIHYGLSWSFFNSIERERLDGDTNPDGRAIMFKNKYNIIEWIKDQNIDISFNASVNHFPAYDQGESNPTIFQAYTISLKAKQDCEFYLLSQAYIFSASHFSGYAMVYDLYNNDFYTLLFPFSDDYSSYCNGISPPISLKAGRYYKIYFYAFLMRYRYYGGNDYAFAWQTIPQSTISSTSGGYNMRSIHSNDISSNITQWFTYINDSDYIEWVDEHDINIKVDNHTCSFSINDAASNAPLSVVKEYLHDLSNNTIAEFKGIHPVKIMDDGYIETRGINDMYITKELTKVNVTKWINTTGAPSARYVHSMFISEDRYLYVMGGINSSGSAQWDLLFQYDLINNTWNNDGTYAGNRAHEYAFWYDDSIKTLYTFGGRLSSNYYNFLNKYVIDNSTYSYTFSTLTAHGASGSPSTRRFSTMVKYENCLYLFGGENGSTYYSDFWKFDLDTDTWSEIHGSGTTNTPSIRGRHSMNIYKHYIYVIGGFNGSNNIDDSAMIWMYDLYYNNSGAWRQVHFSQSAYTPSISSRTLVSTIVENFMIIFNGNDRNSIDNKYIHIINLDNHTIERHTNQQSISYTYPTQYSKKLGKFYIFSGYDDTADATTDQSIREYTPYFTTVLKNNSEDLNTWLLRESSSFYTYTWLSFQVYAKTYHSDYAWDLPTIQWLLEHSKQLEERANQADWWIPCYGQHGEKMWAHLGSAGHTHLKLHQPYPSWGDSTTSYSFRRGVVMVRRNKKTVDLKIEANRLIVRSEPGVEGVPQDALTITTHNNGVNNDSSTKETTCMSILAPGDSQRAAIYFGTQYMSEKFRARKTAIIVEGANYYDQGDMHFCTENSTDDNDVTIDDSRMVIKSNGNVGIGTTSPIYELEVKGGAIGVTYDSDHNYGLYMNMPSASYAKIQTIRQGVGYNYNLALQPSGGNVGIGTTSPSYPLHIEGGEKGSLWMGRVTNSTNYQGLYCWGGHHIDIYNSGSIKTPQSTTDGTNCYINHYAHYQRTGVFTAFGGPVSAGYNGGDNGAAGAGRKVLHIGATYNKTGFSWGWWIGGQNENWSSSDGDLYFHVCRGSTTGHDAGYLLDQNSNTVMNFTGQHRTFVKDIPHKKTEPYIGLIVSANQNKYIKMGDKKMGGVETGNKAITISEALPVVALTTKEKDKSCFGVICDVEDEERREFGGNFKSIYQKEKGDTRTFINSLGEGGIWVTNKNGNLESGDYITSSIIPGYGQKQDSEFLANYTVAKITMDCDFNPQQQKVKKIKKHDIKVTYYKSVIPKEDAKREWHDKPTPYYDYKEEDDEWVSILDEKNYNALKDEEWDGDWENPTKSCYTAFEKDELENDMDENNEFIWEDTDEYEYAYNLRYLLEDGTQITKQEYETKKANNETVYIAAFVGCTYHCG